MRSDLHYSNAYKNYVLWVLTFLFALNSFDSTFMILAVQPIKEELHLSDSQVGFMTGIAFGLFYATLGVPIARIADRGNRSTLTAIAIGLWGLTVMCTVFVSNFVQMVLARVAAGIGESGCMPSTYSLLGDYFTGTRERTRAMSTYMLASPLAPLLSFIVGGWLMQNYGWRKAFFMLGVPGLLFAIVIKLTVREPRAAVRDPGAHRDESPPFRNVLAAMWRLASLRHQTIAFVILCTMGLGMSPWFAAFLSRSHGMHSEEVGVWLGMIFGIGGTGGVVSGGYVANRWFPKNERAQLRLSALMVSLLVPCNAVFLLVPQKVIAFGALFAAMFLCNFIYGPCFSLIQRLAGDYARATTIALLMLLANLIGLGVGPQIVGILSDTFQARFGADSLRYAMLLMSSIALWAAGHFWAAAASVTGDLARVDPTYTGRPLGAEVGAIEGLAAGSD
jgi:MFS family permease